MGIKEDSFKKLLIKGSILFAIAAMIKAISFNRDFIEKYYSTLVYSKISVFLRVLTGWIPFSIGDIMYIVLITCFFIKLIKYINAAFQKKITKKNFLFELIKTASFFLTIYVLFNIIWGLNYNRLGIAYQLQIEPKEYTTNQLRNLTSDLVKAVNAARNMPGLNSFQFKEDNVVFSEAIDAYRNIQQRYFFLAYNHPSAKATLIGGVDNYFGFVGYYDPFTGEAQVNTSMPRFLLPYTITHEIAHQLGYANEDEANFVGYLASKSADENAFRYSAYFTLFNYANRQLFSSDSITANKNYATLDSLVKKDEIVFLSYLGKKPSVGDRYITELYSDYLKANNQPKGMGTYDQVISWLIAYQRRYGEL